jgi:hypothetical protein
MLKTCEQASDKASSYCDIDRTVSGHHTWPWKQRSSDKLRQRGRFV